MVKDKKGPVAAIIMERMKGKTAPKEDSMEMDEGSEESMDEGLIASSEELISALETKDPQAVMEALKSFIEQC